MITGNEVASIGRETHVQQLDVEIVAFGAPPVECSEYVEVRGIVRGIEVLLVPHALAGGDVYQAQFEFRVQACEQLPVRRELCFETTLAQHYLFYVNLPRLGH